MVSSIDSTGTVPAVNNASQVANGLQLLRVSATLLVVFAHAALAYVVIPLRGTVWHVLDPSCHLGLDVFAYWVNGFAMPLFFFLAGVSAPGACAARGVKTFLKHRIGRFIPPLIFAAVAILPISYLLWGVGLLLCERCTMHEIFRMKFSPDIQRYAYGPMHLWFLEYLMVVCVIWGALWKLGMSRICAAAAKTGALQRLCHSAWRPLAFALPTILLLGIHPDTIMSLANTFVPDPWRLMHYLIFFIVGAIWGKSSATDTRLGGRATTFGMVAIVAFGACGPWLLEHARAPLATGRAFPLVVLYSLANWFMLFALIDGHIAVARRSKTRWHFLAEASFWVYLIHYPFVGLTQVLLQGVSAPALVKFLLTAAIAVTGSLVTYELCVRYSKVGKWINGGRKRTKWRRAWHAEVAWVSCLVVSVSALGGTAYSFRTFLWHDNFYQVDNLAVYRCARLAPDRFQTHLKDHQIRTVINLAGNRDEAWAQAQQSMCAEAGVQWISQPLPPSDLPSAEQLAKLAACLSQAPQPILLQGQTGTDRVSLAAAVALLVSGASVEEAELQFGVRYFELAGITHTQLAKIVREYGHWLTRHHQTASEPSFALWSRQLYPTWLSDYRGRTPAEMRVAVQPDRTPRRLR